MRRVAVTGMGVVSPIGTGRDDFFRNLVSATSGVRRIRIPDAERLGCSIAAQIQDFEPAAHFTRERISQLDRFSQFALVAAREAWSQAALPEDSLAQCATYFATGLGGASTLEAGYDALFRRNSNRVRPLSVIAAMPNAAAANIGIEFGLRGPNYTYAIACASSAVAIGEAYRAIAAGWIDAAVTGGSEALLCFGILKAWEGLLTLATEDPAAPETSCRPFARDRTGFVLGEGAGVIVLEELDQARRRNASVIAEIVGYGVCNDAGHLSRPTAEGQASAIRLALADACAHGIDAAEIGYVNAHGTATKIGDATEVQSIREAFAAFAPGLAVSSTKAIHGHLMGATGVVELIATVMAIQRGILPPTAHLHNLDTDLDLDFVPLVARPCPGLRAAISNSFAFGGTNAVLAVAKPS